MIGFRHIPFSPRILSVTKRFVRKSPFPSLPPPKFEKRLDIVILGHVNVGKSVLLNCLIEDKVAATSRKRHTTRFEILGVFNHRNVQLAFYDTPGYVQRNLVTKENVNPLREVSEKAVEKADVILLVVDASLPLTDSYKDAFSDMVKLALKNAKMEVILVLNKVDLVTPKPKLLDLTCDLVSLINGIKLPPEEAKEASLDTTTFMISASENDGVVDIKNYLLSLAEIKPWIIPKERGNSNLDLSGRIEQVILEMMLDHAHEEIPYIASIKTQMIKSLKHQYRIGVDIFVDSPAQQRILVGHQGRTLVKIRQSAVEVLEKMLGKQVILFIYINVRGNQTDAAEEEK